jgi:DNA-binding transcriptional LysR family regulator
MAIKWLEDYLALIESGSFSAAARKRNVSQPAFSRRIQQLEEWLGVVLIDRSRKPLCFTPLAEQHETNFRRLMTQIYEFRANLRADSAQKPDLVLAAQHSLAASRLPSFIEELKSILPDRRFRIRSENRDSGVALLLRGEADVLLIYETAEDDPCVPRQLAKACLLGNDSLVLVASPRLVESEDFKVPSHPLPLLSFPPESFFGQALRMNALTELMSARLVEFQHVSEFSLGLREMALMHQGAAWLPRSLVAADLDRGALRELELAGARVPLKIVAYFANGRDDAAWRLAEHFVALKG